MKIKLLKVFIFITLLSCTGVEQAVKPVLETDSEREEVAPTEVILATSIDYGVLDRWYKTISDSVPKISQSGSFVRGQNIYILLFVINYGIKDGIVEMYYDLNITAPNNTEYLKKTNLRVLDGSVPGVYVNMAEEQIGLSFEPDDPEGIYEIEVTLHDRIKDVSVSASKTIELKEYTHGEDFADDNEYFKWAMNYYDNPEPFRVISGCKYYASSPVSDNNNAFASQLGFYREIFLNNSYLAEQVMEDYETLDLRTKMFITYVFFYMNKEETNRFLEGLKDECGDIYTQLKDYSRNFAEEPITTGEQLDYLWGCFFASGKYQYILSLVNEMEFSVSTPAISGAAIWSVGSNCKQHRLVRDYCEYIYMYENISQEVRDNLENILD